MVLCWLKERSHDGFVVQIHSGTAVSAYFFCYQRRPFERARTSSALPVGL